MPEAVQPDYAIQSRLVRALMEGMGSRSANGRVRLIETHISWVLLAGRYAYKIKKAVDLDFLDFSTLDKRLHYCEEEIRLNRRLAPRIYLDVIAIGGSVTSPVTNGQPVIEYAVRMRRFASTKLLDRLVFRHKILPTHIDSLAATIAQFHRGLPVAAMDSPFGNVTAVYAAAAQNFEHLQALLSMHSDIEQLSALRESCDNEFEARRQLFELRRVQGYVRECHGDLHLGNIVLLDDQPIPFDGIEFNPALRWIDVMSEVAFTVMDLQYFKRDDLAWRFLNAWLEATGDYAGIPLLRFYTAYRAMVRAKVNAIRAAQPAQSQRAAAAAWRSCRAYLGLAERCYARKKPALIITHGLPGSGKSTFAQIGLQQLQAIRLRSDVERKRLFGLAPLADSRASAGIDLYGADISQLTYARLHELARELLVAGYVVIVDAAFLAQDRREHFHRLAEGLSVPFVIASMQAAEGTLRERIEIRHRGASDASEADIAVLEKLRLSQQPLSAQEKGYAAEFINERAEIAADSAGWSRLAHLLGRD